MLGICLRILSILGIVLLILLAVVIGGIVLVLFFPVSYRIYGGRDESDFRLTVKIKWLLGLLSVSGRYPEPGEIRVRLLFLTLYRQNLFSHEEKGEDTKADAAGKSRKNRKSRSRKSRKKSEISGEQKKPGEPGTPAPLPETPSLEDNPASGEASSGPEDFRREENREETVFHKSAAIIEKIKYTIRNIYDKIKKIWENISYYIDLLRQEETKVLLSDSGKALGRILKSIRPRRIRADIRFGTGAPDTTGYVYGAYCMLSSCWGQGFVVTPDFEEAVFEGEFDVSGRITVWILLVNGLKMYKLIRRLIAGMKKPA